jgi:hypothetical protein
MILMMTYDTFDVVHLMVFWKLENAAFPKLNLFPSSGEGELLVFRIPFERSNL